MPRIDLSKATPPLLRTSLWYGETGVGKTEFCCSFPRVAWFGSPRETGYDTIAAMAPSSLYEADRPPRVYTIRAMPELMESINEVLPLVAKGEISTLAIELSIYADDLIRARKDEESWQKYIDLEAHVMYIDEQMKKLPKLRVCYNALVTDPADDKRPAGPLIAGRALAKKLPAICGTVGYIRMTDEGQIVHLRQYGPYPAKHRLGREFPTMLRDPTFRLVEALYKGDASIDSEGTIKMKGEKVTCPNGHRE